MFNYVNKTLIGNFPYNHDYHVHHPNHCCNDHYQKRNVDPWGNTHLIVTPGDHNSCDVRSNPDITGHRILNKQSKVWKNWTLQQVIILYYHCHAELFKIQIWTTGSLSVHSFTCSKDSSITLVFSVTWSNMLIVMGGCRKVDKDIFLTQSFNKTVIQINRQERHT